MVQMVKAQVWYARRARFRVRSPMVKTIKFSFNSCTERFFSSKQSFSFSPFYYFSFFSPHPQKMVVTSLVPWFVCLFVCLFVWALNGCLFSYAQLPMCDNTSILSIFRPYRCESDELICNLGFFHLPRKRILLLALKNVFSPKL